LYFTDNPEYANRVYANGQNILLFCWILIGNVYPVINSDMPKLQGKNHYQNYDTHYVPVVPADPNNTKETMYPLNIIFFLLIIY